jgi:type I restriction enzyme, S subunit
MSKLDTLIKDLCPDGVEYKTLDQIAENHDNERKPITSGNRDFGQYPYYGASGIVDYVEDYIFDGDFLLISEDGANLIARNTPIAFSINGKNWINNHVHVLRFYSLTTQKFVEHYLESLDLTAFISGAAQPKLNQKNLNKIPIPVPPLPVQNEIVRILDNFTELTARKQQYEYYRYQLLTFSENDNKVRWMKLGEVCKKVSSGGTPLKSGEDYYGGNIPWLRTQEVKFVNILQTENTITELGLKNSSAKWIPANCVIVAISGATAARCAINKVPLTTNQHCCNLEVDQSVVLYKYVFFWIVSQYEQLKALGQGARSDLNVGIIMQYGIPVPQINEQQRIVNILDRFDSLCNDITTGLPAEIEARRKQYEYYRDKLLTFKELGA